MTQNQHTRLAGFFYLLLVIFGILNLMYVPSQLNINWEDATKTVDALRQSQTLFKWGIVFAVISYFAFIGLLISLFYLLKPVDKVYAAVMAVLGLISIPISYINLTHKLAVLSLLGNDGFVQLLSQSDLEFQVMSSLSAYNDGINISQIFWGLWLFPFGYLVFKSGFLPKVLGIFLMLGCFGYLTEFFAGLLIPTWAGSTTQSIIGLPATIGEIGICLWMLIAGARTIKFQPTKN